MSENLGNFSHNFVCLDLKLLIIKLKIRPKRKQPSNISIKILYTFWYKIQWANILKIRYIDDMAILWLHHRLYFQISSLLQSEVRALIRRTNRRTEPVSADWGMILYWQNQNINITHSLLSPLQSWALQRSEILISGHFSIYRIG